MANNQAVAEQETLDEAGADAAGLYPESNDAAAEKEAVEKPEQKADKAAKADEGKEEGEKDAKADPEYSDRVQKRIDREVGKRRALEREVAELKKVLTSSAKDAKADDATGIKEPDPNEYTLLEHDPKYIRDLLKFERAQILADVEKRQNESRSRDAETAEKQKFAQKAEKFWEIGSKKFDDFEDLKEDPDLIMSAALSEAFIDEPEYGVEAAYYLAQNPEALEKVQAMSPNAQVRWFGRYVAEAEAKQASVKTKTKAVGFKPVKGSQKAASIDDRPIYDQLYPDN